MSREINDNLLIETICGSIKTYVDKEYKRTCDELEAKGAKSPCFAHPLDEAITGKNGLLMSLKPVEQDTPIDYSKSDKLDELWLRLLEKSIKCLRYFDTREPFQNRPEKRTIAYGLDQLKDYHDRYTGFEGLLYGANPYYRDHVFHVVRTWMLGVFILLHENEGASGNRLVDAMTVDGEPDSVRFADLLLFEKISMWTVVALCHDLGYPLEKAEDILGKTRGMMAMFVPYPNIWSNFTYTGTQDAINDYIVKFMSTKLYDSEKRDEGDNVIYFGRIQSKYYLKYAKSLERFKHGMISSIILYKNLLYFMESDFNLNDDRAYAPEDARQFYIRREMLRAISAHTCNDVYNLSLTTLSSILFLCDELQEWGRKNWMSLYTGANGEEIDLKLFNFSKDEVEYEETIPMGYANSTSVANTLKRVYERQYSAYRLKFRDGQYTTEARYKIKKTTNLKIRYHEMGHRVLRIEFGIGSDGNYFRIDDSDLPERERVATDFRGAISESDLYCDEIELRQL